MGVCGDLISLHWKIRIPELLRSSAPNYLVVKKLGDEIGMVLDNVAHPESEDDLRLTNDYAERIKGAW